MAKKILSTVLVGGLLLSSSAFAKENISLAMSKVYGQYNNIHRCWVLRDDYSYCMKIASVNSAVDTQGKEYVYLLANGDAIEDEGHVHAFSSGGRIGMIIYKSAGPNNIQIIASQKNISAGMDGYAPSAESFSLVKIGPDRWAWRFDDEEGRQGNNWKNTVFYTQYKQTIRPVFSLTTEESVTDWQTSQESTLKKRTVEIIESSGTDSGFYPIEIEVRKTSGENVRPGKYTFRFNPRTGEYVPPAGSSIAIDLANEGK